MSDRRFIHQILKTTDYDAYGQPASYKGHVLRLTRNDERPQNPALPFAYLFPALESMEGKLVASYDEFFGYNYYFELATLSDDHANTNSRPNTLPKRPRYFFGADFGGRKSVGIEDVLIPAFDDNMIEDLKKLGVLFMSGTILKHEREEGEDYPEPDYLLAPFMADLAPERFPANPSEFRAFQVFSLLEPEHYIGGDLFLYYESFGISNTVDILPEIIRIDNDDVHGGCYFKEVGISEVRVDYARWNSVLAQFNEHASRYRKVFVYTPKIRMGEPEIAYQENIYGQVIDDLNEGFARAAAQAVYDIQIEFLNLFSSQVPDHVEFYVSDYTLDQTAGVLQEMTDLIHKFFTQD